MPDLPAIDGVFVLFCATLWYVMFIDEVQIGTVVDRPRMWLPSGMYACGERENDGNKDQKTPSQRWLHLDVYPAAFFGVQGS